MSPGGKMPAVAPASSRSIDPIAPGGHGSFIDRLTHGIASLPFGGWWVYALLLIGAGTWATVVRWTTGAAPVGEVDLTTLTFAFFLPYWLAMISPSGYSAAEFSIRRRPDSSWARSSSLAAARVVPLAPAGHVVSVASVVALWPVAYQMWKRRDARPAVQPQPTLAS